MTGGCGLHVYNGSWSRKVPGFRATLNHMAVLEGPVSRPSSTTSVFTLVSQHDTNMEDNMDWEAEWNELANN